MLGSKNFTILKLFRTTQKSYKVALKKKEKEKEKMFLSVSHNKLTVRTEILRECEHHRTTSYDREHKNTTNINMVQKELNTEYGLEHQDKNY